MGKPAARITDMHVCPMFTALVPHVGGPIVAPSCPTVMVGKMPAAGMGSVAICVGPPDSIILGSATYSSEKNRQREWEIVPPTAVPSWVVAPLY